MNNNSSNKYLNDNDFPIKQEIILQKKNTSKSQYQQNRDKNKQQKKNTKIFIIIPLYMLCLITLTFSTLKVLDWDKDNKKTTETIKKIEQITEVVEVIDDETTELVNEPQEPESDYWYYIKFPLIEVNFEELKIKNSDTIAWIQVNNTNINYPIVQTNNNDFYLDHSYDKTYNDAGWVFMDYRNTSDFNNKNNILYAHSRLDKTMFGSLSKVLKYDWYQNKDNHIIKISTPTENTLWQIFSVYKIEEEIYYITTNFESNDNYKEFLTTLKNRSKFNFNTSLNENDIILTLSTCYSETERTVVHAKMIKKSPRTS